MTAYIATLLETGLTMRVEMLPGSPKLRRAGERPLCTGVRDQLIPPAVLIEAHAEADRLAAELGIPVPWIRWFSPKDEAPHDWSIYGALEREGLQLEGDLGDFYFAGSTPRDGAIIGGLAAPDGMGWGPHGDVPTILLLHTLRGDVLRMVIAHELRHIHQDPAMSRHEREADAERFGIEHVAA